MSADMPTGGRAAAFFDVDGTLIDSTIVHYYRYFTSRRLSPARYAAWYVWFHLKCAYYLVLDRLDRTRFNVAFYRNYGGLPAARIKSWAGDCFREVILPRFHAAAAARVAEHRDRGDTPVLVTGSIDFIMAPLASELGIQEVIAPSLLEKDGAFSGKLDGPPIGGEEKAVRMRRFAREKGFDLSRSSAYGDSSADLPMLEAVGFPHAVNPDGKLAAVAASRGWPILRWSRGVGTAEGC